MNISLFPLGIGSRHARRLFLPVLVLGVVLVALPASAADKCVMFEVEVSAIDQRGQFQPLHNLGQALRVGETWHYSTSKKDIKLEVEIRWEEALDPNPVLRFRATQGPAEKPSILAAAKLEKLIWDHLLGPEPFVDTAGKPVVFEKVGGLFVVAAISDATCETKL